MDATPDTTVICTDTDWTKQMGLAAIGGGVVSASAVVGVGIEQASLSPPETMAWVGILSTCALGLLLFCLGALGVYRALRSDVGPSPQLDVKA